MHFLWFFLLIFPLLSLASTTASPWSAIAKSDLAHIYTEIKENHPGYLDEQNPDFKIWLDKGYNGALTSAEKATELKHVITLSNTFIAGFADGHLSVDFTYNYRRYRWAGLIIAKYGNDYRVRYSETGYPKALPPKNAILLSCDKQAAEQIMQRYVLKHRFNDATLNGPKVKHAHLMLIDDGIGEQPAFKDCIFEINGEPKSFAMHWQGLNTAKYVQVTANEQRDTNFKLETIASNQYWLSLPTFQPTEEQQKALRQQLTKLASVRDKAELIVLDMRGNGGGNSQWGYEVAQAMYGEDYIDAHKDAHPDNSQALWRVSTGNAKHAQAIVDMVGRQFGEGSEPQNYWIEFAARIKQGLAAGKSYVRQGSSASNIKATANTLPLSLKAKVLFLTDVGCASACLDFADLMLKLPNVTHVGQETFADTVYMDVRHNALPSQLGYLVFPVKVYRGRPRGNNESYLPKYIYNQDLDNTPAVKQWLGTLPMLDQQNANF